VTFWPIQRLLRTLRWLMQNY